MARFGVAALAIVLPIVACAQSTQESTVQRLVDRATLTVEDVMTSPNSADVGATLKKARAVIVCPEVFKAGFILGGSGGGCVLVARAAQGSWSGPAFYDIGSGSVGLQAGIQDAQVLMMIMNDKALNAVINSQFKIGADASIAIATIGAGIGGSTTAALNADIVTFAQARGLFAGISLDGALLSADFGADKAYYNKDVDARQIVIGMQANNPGDNPLRAVLARYGG